MDKGNSILDTLPMIFRVGLEVRMRNLGIKRVDRLLAAFGVSSVMELINSGWGYDGPLWYHGTSASAGKQIEINGFDPKMISTHTGNWGMYGAGFYFGSLYEASGYGKTIVCARLSQPFVPWDDPQCIIVRRAAGWPAPTSRRYYEMAKRQSACRALAAKMRQQGISAVNGRTAAVSEFVVYDPSVIQIEGVYRASELLTPSAD